MNSSLRVAFMGRPGCGKGTQSRLLATKLGLVHVTTSSVILKTIPTLSDEERDFYQGFYDRGENLPPDAVAGWLASYLKEVRESGQGLALEGSPRSVEEAEELAKLGVDWSSYTVAWITISDKEAFERMKFRRECARCKEPIPHFPEFEGVKVCHQCGGELVRRKNETDEVIQQRLNSYKKQTDPLRDYFQEKGVLLEIDGEQDIDKVFSDIEQNFSTAS